MAEHLQGENDFLNQLKQVVESNLSDEGFGVSEFADAIGMSRSNLLRKVKKLTDLSVSQYIRQIRLEHGMKMLKENSKNVSEVAFAVGFASTSYFVKCFREHYGFPPGEAGKRSLEEEQVEVIEEDENLVPVSSKRKSLVGAVLIGVALVVLVAIIWLRPRVIPQDLEKSIAVLPFKNDSNDSSNVYLINGLMESTLNNLQKIKGLRVISRTSSEKYRNSDKSIPEIAEELGVSYFVEGSGQKIGDKILLNVQLIEASTDSHLWARQYTREVTSIFDLQQEIAKSIAGEVQVIVTPQEQDLIEKTPTSNIEAYDAYLKGSEYLWKRDDESLRKGIVQFEKALDLDNKFALAYASLAMCYFHLDIFKEKKEYLEEVNNYSDKALLYDPHSAFSLMSKAMYYMSIKEYDQMTPYLEKALEYNPNSADVINMLSEYYANYNPNTQKYLEYALKGVKLNVAAYDSTMTSYFYLHLSNALIQSGFVNEAFTYVNKSLDFNPQNPFSSYLKAFIIYAQDDDLATCTRALVREWKKDTTRLDILQDVGKAYYFQHRFDSAYYYYSNFLQQREANQMDIYRNQHAIIAVVFQEMGMKKEAEAMMADFKDFAEHDQSIYKDLLLVAYYSYYNEREKAIEHLAKFSETNGYMYWLVLFGDDPLMKNIEDLPEYKRLMKKVRDKFWANHDLVRTQLEDEGLI